MSLITIIALGLLAAAALMTVWRMLEGPHAADRVVAVDALAVLTTPGIVWLAHELDNSMYLDVALTYAALGVVGVLALARFLGERYSEEQDQ